MPTAQGTAHYTKYDAATTPAV